MPKLKNSNATFCIISKHCVYILENAFSVFLEDYKSLGFIWYSNFMLFKKSCLNWSLRKAWPRLAPNSHPKLLNDANSVGNILLRCCCRLGIELLFFSSPSHKVVRSNLLHIHKMHEHYQISTCFKNGRHFKILVMLL